MALEPTEAQVDELWFATSGISPKQLRCEAWPLIRDMVLEAAAEEVERVYRNGNGGVAKVAAAVRALKSAP